MNPVPNPSREDVTFTFAPKLERGECSELPRREAPQSHGRKSVAQRLLPLGYGSSNFCFVSRPFSRGYPSQFFDGFRAVEPRNQFGITVLN